MAKNIKRLSETGMIWYPVEDLEGPPSGGVGLVQGWLLSADDAFFQEVLVMVTGGYRDAGVRSDEDEAPHRWLEHGGRPVRAGGPIPVKSEARRRKIDPRTNRKLCFPSGTLRLIWSLQGRVFP